MSPRKLLVAASSSLLTFAAEEEGATGTEYAVMLALIIVTAMGAIQTYGTSFLNMLYVDICSKVNSATGS